MDHSSTLEEKTLAYWNTSSTFHGKPSQTPEMNIQQGLKSCGDNLMFLGPHRRLAYRTQQLQDALIDGKPRRKSKTAVAATVLPMKRAHA